MKTKSLIMRKLKSALIAKVFFILTFIIGLKGTMIKRRLGKICVTIYLVIPKQLDRRLLCKVGRATGNEKAAAYFSKVRGN